MDQQDPLFDSMEGSSRDILGLSDGAVTESTAFEPPPRPPQLGLREFVTKVTPLIREFFATRNDETIFEGLLELDSSHFHDMFALKLIRMSFDQSDQVQSQVRSLLTLLHDSKVLKSSQVLRVFEKLVQSCEDLCLDVPDVADRLVNFVEDACNDNVLPSAFVAKLPESFFRMISPRMRAANPEIDSHQDKLHSYKVACQDFLASNGEFFRSTSNGEAAAEAAESFLTTEATNSNFRHEFIRILLRETLSKPQHTKEVVSDALIRLVDRDLISSLDIEVGFARMIGRVEDLRLDVLDAPLVISKFLAKAIVDDILHPGIVWDYHRLHLGGREGMELLARVRTWLVDERVTPFGLEERQKHGLVSRFARIFESDYDPAVLPAKQFRRQLRELIFAFYDDGELDDTADHIISLELSEAQKAELVRRVLAFSLERREKEELMSLSLLAALLKSDALSHADIARGAEELKASMDDLAVDCPKASDRVPKLIETLVAMRLLS